MGSEAGEEAGAGAATGRVGLEDGSGLKHLVEDLGDLVTSETTREYCDALDSLIDGTLITDVKIYLDLP